MDEQNFSSETDIEKHESKAENGSSGDKIDDSIKNTGKEIFEWVESLSKAFSIMFLLVAFVFRVVTVEGTSMLPTLEDQDRLIITNFLYTPQRGDIIVLQADNLPNELTGELGKPIIKRVIAVAGDKIDIDKNTGDVFVNNNKLEEGYIKEKIAPSRLFDFDGEVIVPENYVFVLGDNRNNSRDSRDSAVGLVDLDTIMGEAQLRISPFDKFGGLYE